MQPKILDVPFFDKLLDISFTRSMNIAWYRIFWLRLYYLIKFDWMVIYYHKPLVIFYFFDKVWWCHFLGQYQKLDKSLLPQIVWWNKETKHVLGWLFIWRYHFVNKFYSLSTDLWHTSPDRVAVHQIFKIFLHFTRFFD